MFAGAEVLQREPDTLTVSTKLSGRLPPVKASFFGGVDEGELAEVDAATRRYVSEQAGRWDLTVSTIARAASTVT